jgi:nucleoid-associated protein YgaU
MSMIDSGASPTSYDDLLVALASWVLRGCAAWGALILLAAVVESLSRGRVRATSWVATPPTLRRALLAALGVLLAGAAPGPVSAAVVLGPNHRPEPWAPGGPAGLLPPPERPDGGPPPVTVRVRVGDTLWSLAAARLPRGAADREVLAAVHRWHAHNRHVIGPDPDLLLPGQRLEPPARHRHHPPHEETR